MGQRDHSAINDPVSDFLTSANNGRRLNRDIFDVRRTEQAENQIVKDACRAETALEGWISLSQSLELMNPEFSALVEASCGNYRENEPYRGERAGRHEFILQVVGLGDVTDLIDDICGPSA